MRHCGGPPAARRVARRHGATWQSVRIAFIRASRTPTAHATPVSWIRVGRLGSGTLPGSRCTPRMLCSFCVAPRSMYACRCLQGQAVSRDAVTHVTGSAISCAGVSVTGREYKSGKYVVHRIRFRGCRCRVGRVWFEGGEHMLHRNGRGPW